MTDIFDLTKILMGLSDKEYSDNDILDLLKEARDKRVKGSPFYIKLDNFIKKKEKELLG